MNRTKFKFASQGFTLIEVLIALSIIAIALTALLKSTAQTVYAERHIQEKLTSHFVAMQGITMVQLGLLEVKPSQELTHKTHIFNQEWYWRIRTNQTQLKNVQELTVTVSKNQSGPFHDPLTAFYYPHG